MLKMSARIRYRHQDLGRMAGGPGGKRGLRSGHCTNLVTDYISYP